MWCVVCDVLFWTVGVVMFIFALGGWMNGQFKRRGVMSPTTYIPFIGHMLPTLTKRKHFKDFAQDLYTIFPDERYIGITQITNNLFVLRDIELIKQVAVKDFDHFLDKMSSLDENADFIFGKSLLGLKGQKWRDMRATLSPAFTSSKMKGMFQFILDCGEQMSDYFMEQMKKPENKVRGMVELEMKDAFTRYANDVIATSAFGLKVDSFTEKNNEFYLMGKEATDLSGFKKTSKFLILMLLPRLAKMLGVTLFESKIYTFYRKLVWDTVKYREDNKVTRQDMIQILMEARKGTLKHDSHDDGKDAGFATVEESAVGKTTVKRVWTDDDLVAQALLFFFAGFDTASTLLCFMAHELALHPEIQRKLQQEIDEVAAGVDGKLTYDCLQKMKYMDMVVSETLRMWPPVVAVDRKCVKPYTLPPPREGGREVHLTEGEGVWIPVYGFHHDPKYFKNPEKFDPERFSDENKDNIQQFSYLPFGVGPRNCIGSRFALMEVKAVIYNLLHKFDIVTTAKTQNPIKLIADSFSMNAENGFWFGFKPREKKQT